MSVNTLVSAGPTGPGRSADRRAAIWIGVLFIIGTVGLVLSLVVTDGILTGPASLGQIAAEPNRVAIGAVLVLLAAFALAMVPVVFWPVGRRHDETLAMGYVVFRGAIETVLYMAIALGWLVLIPLSTEPAAGPLAGIMRTTESVISNQVLSIPFALGCADVLRPALPVAARSPVAVRLGARGWGALPRGSGREHVRALAWGPDGPTGRSGNGHGGLADHQGLQPICSRSRAGR